jgi:small subunit ribosomal protein S16
MLTIRLTRKGKKNQPFFRVVVIDKRRSAKGGRPAEILGYIDPLTKRKSLNKERILHWIGVGAQPSETMHNLLVSEKIIEAKKVNKFKKTAKAKAEEAKKLADEKAAAEAAKVEAQAPAPEATPAPEAPASETPTA